AARGERAQAPTIRGSADRPEHAAGGLSVAFGMYGQRGRHRRHGPGDALAAVNGGFLELPSRSVKPRQQGITHVLDRGLSIAEVDGLVEVAGASVDLVKLGWGTAVATENL